MILQYKGLEKVISSNSNPISFDSETLGLATGFSWPYKSAIPDKAKEGVDFEIFFRGTGHL